MERTLVLLKPDAVQRRLSGSILTRFEQKGLKIVGMKLVQPSTELAAKHYNVHKERPFFGSLVSFLSGGPTVALALEGREAVATVRSMIGSTDGTKASPGTIRGDHGLSVQNNLIHGSDSVDNAQLELALWFCPSELVCWSPVDQSWIG